ncbi:MAG TPA: hypothetical protein VK856_11145 [Anaerolineaceae bacterium]|nr:hypothetical protein [Anaerolineaceae bacterium]
MFSKFSFSTRNPDIIMPSSKKIEENNLSIEMLFGKIVEFHSSQRNSLLYSLTESLRSFCWLQLEEDDHEPGRFWMKFIASLRQHFPDSGKDILNSLIDHHSQPIEYTLKKLTQELQAQPITIIFENIDVVDQQKWWQKDVEAWLNENENVHWIGLFIQSSEQQLSDLVSSQPEQVLVALSSWDMYWIDWLQSLPIEADWQPLFTEMEQSGNLIPHTQELARPPHKFYKALQDSSSEEKLLIRTRYRQQLAEWLFRQGELLELLRLYLQNKDFELAGDLLERNGEAWLHQEIDSLELLFWLRELPSVLLTARPALCWLAALACKQLGLTFLTNYYINAAENSLASFMRFSRVEAEWRKIEVNEAGLSIGWLMDKLEQLKFKT